MKANTHAVRDDVGRDTGEATDEGVLADPGKLLDRSETSHNHSVAHLHVTRELRAVGEGDVVSDPAIMARVTVGHEIVPVAHASDPAAALAARADRHTFTDDVVIANDQPRVRSG